MNACGQIKISLQYFENSSQLRVFLGHITNIEEINRKTFIKITLYNGQKKVSSKKVRPTSRTAGILNFVRDVFLQTSDRECSVMYLKMALYQHPGRFRRAHCVGQTVITLDKRELGFETTRWLTFGEVPKV